jgi:two-component system, cell cycle response regulator DivK
MIMARSSFNGEAMDAIQMTQQPPVGRRERQLVLLVDDDPHDREIYGSILCYNGFDVVCANDGRSGVRLAQHHRPDLVLLDIGLPDVHGLDLCSSLRKDPDTAAIPVIALSAYAEMRMGEQARDAGCTRYIEKPASPVAVLHEIEQLVGKAPLPGDGAPPRMTQPESDDFPPGAHGIA